MKFKVFGVITTSLLLVFLTGCTENANNANTNTANTNVNANANANVAVANQNENANANTKKAPTRADYEKNKQSYAEEAKNLGRKIGTGLDDGWLWTKTRFDLGAADDLRDSTINVDVENGAVTLSGTVANAEQKAKAVSIAKAVEGVKSVKDLLKVAANTNSNTANSNTKKK
jgi:osmotically-inducible protein OsmY